MGRAYYCQLIYMKNEESLLYISDPRNLELYIIGFHPQLKKVEIDRDR